MVETHTDFSECARAEEIRHVKLAYSHLNPLSEYMINDWLLNKVEVKEEIQLIDHSEVI